MNESINSQAPENNTNQRGTFSLRAKILLGNLLIALLTVAAMGYFVFNRSQSTNNFLVNQVGVSVNQEIENRLATRVSREANTIHLFFATMRNAIEFFGNTTGAIISNDKTISLEESDWNTSEKLSQLPNGNWDNANTESSSIFIPARPAIRNDVAKTLIALKGLVGFLASIDYFFDYGFNLGGDVRVHPSLLYSSLVFHLYTPF